MERISIAPALCGLGILVGGVVACRAPVGGTGAAGDEAVAPRQRAAVKGSTSPAGGTDETAARPRAPVAAAGEDDPFTFLASRFDADGDGRIVAAEMASRPTSFERLDRDGDGAVTRDDFERGAAAGREAMRARMQARRVVERLFQADEERTLSREELAGSFDVFDRDHDGTLGEAEWVDGLRERFGDEAGELPLSLRRFVERHDPFAAMRAVVDGDEDGRVGREELLSFFDALDDGDGVWGTRSSAPPARARPDGPAPGELAPDFALSGPEGGDPVRLSSFRGEKPVALIFGSYT